MRTKPLFRKITMWSSAAAMLLLICCTEGALVPDPLPAPEPTPDVVADAPFITFRASVGEESVAAQNIDGQRDQMALIFDYAEAFDHVRLSIELNDGYSIVSPKDPTDVDLNRSKEVVFRHKNKTERTYTLNLTTYARPISDLSKIQIVGAEITAEGKLITITYTNPASKFVNVVFGPGSMLPGAKMENLPEDGTMTLDFTKGKIPKVKVMANSREHIYSFNLAMPERPLAPTVETLFTNLKGMGNFENLTSDFRFADTHNYINVFRATSIRNLPAKNWGRDGNSWQMGSEEPVWWANNMDGVAILNSSMAFLGDFTDGQCTTSLDQIDMYVVVAEKSKIKGKIHASKTSGAAINVEADQGLIVLSGANKAQKQLLMVDGQSVEGQILHTDKFFRTAIAFDNSGTLHFTKAGAAADGSIMKMPYCDGVIPEDVMIDDWQQEVAGYPGNAWRDHLVAWDFSIQSLASCAPTTILGGKAIGWRWAGLNDGIPDNVANNSAWAGTRNRAMIGQTADRIIFVAFNDPDGPNWGATIAQVGRVLQKMGCTDLTLTGTSNWQDNDYQGTIFVAGELVCGTPAYPTRFTVAFDAK